MAHDTAAPDDATRTGRRAFLKTSLGAGFALAVQPVGAQTIATPADGLVAGEVTVPVADGAIPAYRAMPETGGPFPTMLVIQEIFGVHEHIRDVCRRFARLGYYAIAPDLFARQGDASKAEIKTILSEIVPRVPDAQVTGDLDAAVAFAKASGQADTARLGATGFCWGGRIVWLYAAHAPGLKAGVAFYGMLGGKAAPVSEIKPKNPLDLAGALKAPVLGLYGGDDPNIPLPLVEAMQAALDKAGSPSSLHVYPGLPHGFFADYRPSYRPEAARDAWARLQAWFKAHGVA